MRRFRAGCLNRCAVTASKAISAIRKRLAWSIVMLLCVAAGSKADGPYGLDSRAVLGAYMNGNLPTNGSAQMPALLSSTTVFTTATGREPHPGLVPYSLISPLWSDGSLKSRFIGLPFDGTIGSAGSPKVGFAETDYWTFPNGTVIVKNFDMLMDERPGYENSVRRLETRILIRYLDGATPRIRGATYKWRPDNSDADIVTSPNGANEPIVITNADGSTRTQNWLYPGPGQCLQCHNQAAGMVLGIKTAQLNGDFGYKQPVGPDRVDNQLHTWNHLGMLTPTLDDTTTYPQYRKMAEIGDTSATLENRARSYIDSNCAHCHRPGGPGPFYDMRYNTPILETNIFGDFGGLIRDDLANSRFYVRDSAAPNNPQGIGPMPPLARDVPDQRVLNVYDQWVNYDYDVMTATSLSATLVRLQFNRPIDATTAATATNYEVDNGIAVSQAVTDTDPSVVFLTTTPRSPGNSHTITINRVKEAALPGNPIWPNTQIALNTPASVPGAPSITMAAAGNGKATLSFTPPTSDGGATISFYTASCSPGPIATTATVGPLTVTGLTNGVTYSCTVTATNSAGTGPASAAMDVTPLATVAGAPTNLIATAGDAFASVAFTAPADDGGSPISGYTVSCTEPSPTASSASGSQSPIIVNGLTNGVTYSCSVVAVNGIGNSAASNPVSVTPAPPSPPLLTAALSRKTHGSAGTFDLPLDISQPVGGAVTVESRAIGAGHIIVFQFDKPVTSVGTVTAVDGTAEAIGNASVQFAGTEVIVTLTGITDNNRVAISLTNLNGLGASSSSVALGFLVGDINNSRSVNATDISGIKARSGQSATPANFKFDLNASGGINATDIAAVKARSGLVLP
jgi:Fibronectin type III domain/Dockerin type I domain